MSGDGVPESEREIVIVRRSHGGHDEGHHGGVWKIAYADFMTAMMAFFLVMWLVNAADDETRRIVASYFNPIELVDDAPAERGLSDVAEPASGHAEQGQPDAESDGQAAGDVEAGMDKNATAGDEERYSDADYFANPYAVLSEIALETGTQMNVSDAGEGGAQTSGPASGASGGEAYRDPFDPDFWSEMQQAEMVDPAPPPADLAPEALAEPVEDAAPEEATPEPVEAAAVAEPTEAELPAEADVAAADSETEQQSPDVPNDAAESEAEALERQIEAALAESGAATQSVEVTPAEGGLLISLADEVQGTMFNIGSAVPQRALVLAMEDVGSLLAERGGAVVIRGHTDARPFAGEGNDNWRLSTARAHSAYYMLVRGGLAPERVMEIAGYADRRLKLPDDPLAPENRRIEILLKTASGDAEG